MVEKPNIAHKLHRKVRILYFLSLLEYTCDFSSVASVCTWDFRYATSICTWDFRYQASICINSAYAIGHVCQEKCCFLRNNPSKWVGRCMNE